MKGLVEDDNCDDWMKSSSPCHDKNDAHSSSSRCVVKQFLKTRFVKRCGAPVRFKKSCISKKDLKSRLQNMSQSETQSAILLTREDKMTKSARTCHLSRLRAWSRAVSPEADFPVTPQSLEKGISKLRVSGYKPKYVMQIMWAVKKHQRLHHSWSGALQSECKELERALKRGNASDEHTAFDVPFLMSSITERREPLSSGGPLWPALSLGVMARWTLREIECPSFSCLDAEVNLSTRTSALIFNGQKNSQGVERIELSCMRPLGDRCNYSIACPSCTLRAYRTHVIQHHAFLQGKDLSTEDLAKVPLFTSETGLAVQKSAMVDTIRLAASSAGLAVKSSENVFLYGGHSLRRSGIRAMAEAGLSRPAIVNASRHLTKSTEAYLERCMTEAAGRVALSLNAAIERTPLVKPYSNDVKCVVSSIRSTLQFHKAYRFVLYSMGKTHILKCRGDYNAPCGFHFASNPWCKLSTSLPEHRSNDLCSSCFSGYHASLTPGQWYK